MFAAPQPQPPRQQPRRRARSATRSRRLKRREVVRQRRARPVGDNDESDAAQGVAAARDFFLRAARSTPAIPPAPEETQEPAPAPVEAPQQAPEGLQEGRTMTLYATLPSGRAALRLRGVPRSARVGALRRAVIGRLPTPLQRSAWLSYRGAVLSDDDLPLSRLGMGDGDSVGVHVPLQVAMGTEFSPRASPRPLSASASSKPRRPKSARSRSPRSPSPWDPQQTSPRSSPRSPRASRTASSPRLGGSKSWAAAPVGPDWSQDPPAKKFSKEQRWPGVPEPVKRGRRDRRRLRGVYGDLNELRGVLQEQEDNTPEAQQERLGL